MLHPLEMGRSLPFQFIGSAVGICLYLLAGRRTQLLFRLAFSLQPESSPQLGKRIPFPKVFPALFHFNHF